MIIQKITLRKLTLPAVLLQMIFTVSSVPVASAWKSASPTPTAAPPSRPTELSPPLAKNYPTAKDVFNAGSDQMLATLTYLSYLEYDKADKFRTYKLMYGLDAQEKERLINFFDSAIANYKDAEGWTIESLAIGKGLFANNDTPGGFIAYKLNKDGNYDINIAFRGTRSLDDWGNNLNFIKTPLRFSDQAIPQGAYTEHYQKGQVHGGFLKAYNTIAQHISDILDNLRRKKPKAEFYIRVGGHSLGGSLATICAAHVAIHPAVTYMKTPHTIHLETYGSPRTLGVKLSQELTTLLGADNIMRFVNKDTKGVKDMVASIPFSRMLTAQFKHIGNECTLTAAGKDIYEGFPKFKVLKRPIAWRDTGMLIWNKDNVRTQNKN